MSETESAEEIAGEAGGTTRRTSITSFFCSLAFRVATFQLSTSSNALRGSFLRVRRKPWISTSKGILASLVYKTRGTERGEGEVLTYLLE